MHVFQKLACLLFLLPASGLAQDSDSTALIGLRFGGGVVQASGSLMDQADVRGFTLDIFRDASANDFLWGMQSSLLFDMWTINGKNTHTAFPFTPNDDLTGSIFSFVPQMCFFANLPLQACFGVGVTQFTLSDEGDNRQSYGTLSWNYEIGRFHQEGFIFGIRGRYDELSQKVAKKEAFAGFASHMIQLGWSWVPGK